MKFLVPLLSLLFILTGCKVGPNYAPPCTSMPTNFIEDNPVESAPISDGDLVHWWERAFNDPFLNQLMEEACLCNFDLGIALERIYQARANYWVQFASILPEFDFDFQATRFRSSQTVVGGSTAAALSPALGGSISPVQDFFQIGLDAVWQIDLFGKLRRTARSAYYSWEASIEDARGVKITVLSETASLYVNICYYQKKVDLAKELIEFSEGLLAMSRERFQSGLANEEEVAEALAAFESNNADLKVLEIALKQSIYSLGILIGRPPETFACDFVIPRPIPIASGKIPETLPCELLRRRPDIASAERALAAQTELIGVAVADLFPSVSLVGSSSSFAANPLQGANVGFASSKFSNLFKSASRIWGIGALITWPVFDFGKRSSNVKIQKFLTNQDYLIYEKTVVTALQEVEIALSNYFLEEERLSHFTRQTGANKRNLDLISDQFQAGLLSYTEVLQAKETWLASVNSMADSQKALGTDFIAIYKALGGDW